MTHRRVRDVMTAAVRTVHQGSPAKVVAERLDTGRVGALPVVDGDGHVVGVVSEADLLHKLTYSDHDNDWPRFLRRHRADRAKADAVSAKDLMSTPAVTIRPAASVVEAAALMERRSVKHLPVVDESGTLVGIVSRGDLIRVFVRPDPDIRLEIETDVFRRILLLPPGTLTVEVASGVVTLRGMLPRASEVEITLQLVRGVDGVVAVDSRLTYRLDDTTYRALRDSDAPRGVYY